MGCDIHMVLEYNDPIHKKWIGVQAYNHVDKEAVCVSGDVKGHEGRHVAVSDPFVMWWIRQRDYEFFAALAGVRGHGPEPLGIPEDVSDLARLMIDSWGDDGHSHTYIDALDFARLFAKHNGEALAIIKKRFIKGDNELEKWASELLNAPSGDIKNYRMVIWFDN